MAAEIVNCVREYMDGVSQTLQCLNFINHVFPQFLALKDYG